MKEFKKEVHLNGSVKEYVVTKEFDEHHDEVETTVELGFDYALVVTVNHNYNNDTLYVCKDIVDVSRVKQAYELHTSNGGIGGIPCGATISTDLDSLWWLIRDSHYWLVRRENGSLYPFPLLFASPEERAKSASRHNDQQWSAYYSGGIPTPRIVDVPSSEEVQKLLNQLKFHVAQGASPWDDLDARGGLVPRWAA